MHETLQKLKSNFLHCPINRYSPVETGQTSPNLRIYRFNMEFRVQPYDSWTDSN